MSFHPSVTILRGEPKGKFFGFGLHSINFDLHLMYSARLKEARLRILSSGKKIGFFFPIPQNLSKVDDQSTNEFLILPTPQISGFLADFDFSKLSRQCRDDVATMSRRCRDLSRQCRDGRRDSVAMVVATNRDSVATPSEFNFR